MQGIRNTVGQVGRQLSVRDQVAADLVRERVKAGDHSPVTETAINDELDARAWGGR